MCMLEASDVNGMRADHEPEHVTSLSLELAATGTQRTSFATSLDTEGYLTLALYELHCCRYFPTKSLFNLAMTRGRFL